MKKPINQLDIMLFSSALFISLPLSFFGVIGVIVIIISYQFRPNLKNWMNSLLVMFIPIFIGLTITEIFISILFDIRSFFSNIVSLIVSDLLSSIFLTIGIYLLFWLIENRKQVIQKIKSSINE